MNTPVDATATEAWADLRTLKDALVPDLRGWFAADPHRAEELTFDLADLRVDLSKNLINDDVVAALVRLAEQVGRAGGTFPAVYNAANEVCVDAFHDGVIGFLDIVDTVARVVDDWEASVGRGENKSAAEDVEDVLAADRWARARATEVIGAL